MGQLTHRAAHIIHKQLWPHGINAVSMAFVKQTRHSLSITGGGADGGGTGGAPYGEYVYCGSRASTLVGEAGSEADGWGAGGVVEGGTKIPGLFRISRMRGETAY